jgi:hypothetical protein
VASKPTSGIEKPRSPATAPALIVTPTERYRAVELDPAAVGLHAARPCLTGGLAVGTPEPMTPKYVCRFPIASSPPQNVGFLEAELAPEVMERRAPARAHRRARSREPDIAERCVEHRHAERRLEPIVHNPLSGHRRRRTVVRRRRLRSRLREEHHRRLGASRWSGWGGGRGRTTELISFFVRP